MRQILIKAIAVCALAITASCGPFGKPDRASSADSLNVSNSSPDTGRSVRLADAVKPILSEWELSGGSGVVLVAVGNCFSQFNDLLAESAQIMNSDTALDAGDNCFGFARPVGKSDRELGSEMKMGAYFDIGSLTKEFTAYAVLKLHAAGMLSLDDAISDYFPDAPADKKPITIRQILTHESGLVDIVDNEGKPIPYDPEIDFVPLSKDEMVARALNAPLVSEPGAAFNYSNFGYSILAVIIESAADMRYQDYIEFNVLKPFGVSMTGYPPKVDVQQEALAVGYLNNERWGTTYEKMSPNGPSWMLIGAGGMVAPVSDFYMWVGGIATAAQNDEQAALDFLSLFSDETGSGARYITSFGSNDIYEAGYLWMIDRELIIMAFTNNSDRKASNLINTLWAGLRECDCIDS